MDWILVILLDLVDSRVIALYFCSDEHDGRSSSSKSTVSASSTNHFKFTMRSLEKIYQNLPATGSKEIACNIPMSKATAGKAVLLKRRNPPRYWKQENRVQYRDEQSGRWLSCTVEAERGYGTAMYRIKTKDEVFLTVDCTLLRPVTHSKASTKE